MSIAVCFIRTFVFSLYRTELACQPVYKNNLIQFKLSLVDVFKCGVTKVVNQGTVSSTTIE